MPAVLYTYIRMPPLVNIIELRADHFASIGTVPLLDFPSIAIWRSKLCTTVAHNALVALFTSVICDSSLPLPVALRFPSVLFLELDRSMPMLRIQRAAKKGSQQDGNLSPANSRLSPWKRIFRSSYGAERECTEPPCGFRVNGGNLRPADGERAKGETAHKGNREREKKARGIEGEGKRNPRERTARSKRTGGKD